MSTSRSVLKIYYVNQLLYLTIRYVNLHSLRNLESQHIGTCPEYPARQIEQSQERALSLCILFGQDVILVIEAVKCITESVYISADPVGSILLICGSDLSRESADKLTGEDGLPLPPYAV